MTEPRDQFGEEVRRLVEAVQEWARRIPDPQAAAAAHAGRTGECLPWCPLCQFANLLRGEHPEVGERFAEAATALASAVKALADVALTRAEGREDTAGRRGESARPRPAPRVEHIRLDDPTEP